MWYIRDAEIARDGDVIHLGSYRATPELHHPGDEIPYFGDVTGAAIRERLRSAGMVLPWGSFRQSWDLRAFTGLDRLLWRFLHDLVGGVARERSHGVPTTLEEWEPFVRFTVLAYASYFEAFYPSDERPVGGGVDVVSIAWPE